MWGLLLQDAAPGKYKKKHSCIIYCSHSFFWTFAGSFSLSQMKITSTGECLCNSKPVQSNASSSSSTSASSVQTQVVHDKKSNGSETATESPHHLLGLGVSLSSPNLLNSAVSLMLSSSSSSESVSILEYSLLWRNFISFKFFIRISVSQNRWLKTLDLRKPIWLLETTRMTRMMST